MWHTVRQAAAAAGLAFVERRALDETFSCGSGPACVGPIHAYQTDSSSKQPAPKGPFNQ